MTRCANWPAAVVLFALCSALRADVVINEIMYHPVSDFDADEFIELHNTGPTAVNLEGWRLEGVGLSFAAAVIQPGQFVIVAKDSARFQSHYGFAANCTYTGVLENGGETLRLLDAGGALVDQVTFDDIPPWPTTPDGTGPSLELINPLAVHNDPRNWRACTASAGHTAGAVNSVNAMALPPWISDVACPVDPPAYQAIVITARIAGATGAALTYKLDFGATTTIAMFDDGSHGDGATGDGVYGGVIPAQPAGKLVRYQILTTGAGGAMRCPRVDDSVSFEGTLVASSAVTTALPRLLWFMDPAAYQAAISHRSTDQTETCVIVYDGKVYDNVQVRVRGAGSRGWPKKHWKFYFPTGHDFTAPSLIPQPVDQFNLLGDYSDKSYLRTALCTEMFRDAGAPCSYAFPVRLEQNGQFYGLYTFLESMDDGFLERMHLSQDNAWYKAYRDCRAQSLSSLPENYQKQTRLFESYDDLYALLQGINQPAGAARTNFLFDAMDLPGMINYLAVTCLIHNNDHVAKNYFLYRNTLRTQRWVMQPWDLDLTLGRNYVNVNNAGGVLSDVIWADDDVVQDAPAVASPSHPLFGDAGHQKIDQLYNHMIDALYQAPQIREMYYRRLRTLCDHLLAPGRIEARIDELVALIAPEAELDRVRWGQYGQAQTLAQAVALIKNDYLAARRTHLMTTHHVANEMPEMQTMWPPVIINEIMYNPPGGEDGEFIELLNPNAVAVDVSGWQINGVGLTLPAGAVIPSHGYGVVVRNDIVFRATYGSGILVLAEYPGEMDNGGENLSLLDNTGMEFDSVRFDDDAPWPTAADGFGRSLELIDATQDNDRAVNWAASLGNGGTPGRANSRAGVTQPVPNLWVNEVLPVNASINIDEAGEFSPWVELYNASGATINVGGMFVTNDYSMPTKWTIPAGTIIASHGFVLIWCDGQTSQGPLHANFMLSAGPGSVGLYTADVRIVDYLNYDPLAADVSYGKAPDGAALRQTFSTPTPASSNLPPTPDVILNEYNAVSSAALLANNGSDTFFGRVAGNGGDWYELVVIRDHTDMRGWQLVISDNTGAPTQTVETQTLSNHVLWSDLRSGTIITIAEDVSNDVSYDPSRGDWWIHVRSHNGGGTTYMSQGNFSVSNDKWQLTIKDAGGRIVFGPAGEGVRPVSGIASTNIWRLAEDPGQMIVPWSDFRAGTMSTFGAPNWRADGLTRQDFSLLRSVCAPRTDVDGNGVVNAADVSAFVDVVLGVDVAPAHRIAADWNCDSAADGDDVQRFVNALLMP